MSLPPVTVQLHTAQKRFRHSEALYRGFVGGIAAGKSFVGAYDLICRAKPNRLYLVTAPTYPMLHDATIRTFLGVAKGVGYLARPFNKSSHIAVLGNGAEVLFRSADDPSRLYGPNASGLWMDEASLQLREAFDIGIGRLREAGEQGWASATFTPKGRLHWTYDVFGKSNPDTACFHARTADNPFTPPGFHERLAQQYTSTQAAQELEGEFLDTAGCLFRRSWFEIVDEAPAELTRVRFWDLAATEQKDANDPDWTVGLLMGKSAAGVYYVLDVRRVRASPAGVEALVKQTASLDGRDVAIWMEQEPGSAGVNNIDHYLRHILAGYNFHGERATGDKVTRASPFAAMAEAGNVKVVRGEWNKAWLDEIELFPLGAKDDQVDGASGAFGKLSQSKARRLVAYG